MEQTQNTNTPPEPKKSFWAKLFGGGKAATPAPTPTIDLSDIGLPATDPAANTASTDAATSNNFSSMPSTSAASPSGWNADSAAAAETPGVSTSAEPVAASWQEQPAASDVPVPPSDPMVTPVEQPVEAPAPAASAEGWSLDQAPAAPTPTAPVVEHDDQVGGDRPSITPPSR